MTGGTMFRGDVGMCIINCFVARLDQKSLWACLISRSYCSQGLCKILKSKGEEPTAGLPFIQTHKMNSWFFLLEQCLGFCLALPCPASNSHPCLLGGGIRLFPCHSPRGHWNTGTEKHLPRSHKVLSHRRQPSSHIHSHLQDTKSYKCIKKPYICPKAFWFAIPSLHN